MLEVGVAEAICGVVSWFVCRLVLRGTAGRGWAHSGPDPPGSVADQPAVVVGAADEEAGASDGALAGRCGIWPFTMAVMRSDAPLRR